MQSTRLASTVMISPKHSVRSPESNAPEKRTKSKQPLNSTRQATQHNLIRKEKKEDKNLHQKASYNLLEQLYKR